MFLSVLNPNPEVRFHLKLSSLYDKVENSYYTIGELTDTIGLLSRQAGKAFQELNDRKLEMDSLVERYEKHTKSPSHTLMCDCDALMFARMDLEETLKVLYANWWNTANQIHQAELQIIALSEKVSSELCKILKIRDDAKLTYERFYGEAALYILNDVIQTGHLLSEVHFKEVEHSDEFAGAR